MLFASFTNNITGSRHTEFRTESTPYQLHVNPSPPTHRHGHTRSHARQKRNSEGVCFPSNVEFCKKKLSVKPVFENSFKTQHTCPIRLLFDFLSCRIGREADQCKAGRRAPCAYLHHYVLPPLRQKDLENSYLWLSIRVAHPSNSKAHLKSTAS